MHKIIHRAASRGFFDHGWLKSYHSFSFAEYHNPERNNFGLLRVLNDDWIDPAQGFGTHPHKNMEIITIPLAGSLKHQDSMGHKEVIQSGEVQRMSAGLGVAHSEYNNSTVDLLNLLQIWIFPKEKNIAPSYEQKQFSINDRQNKVQLLVAPDGREGAVSINQDAFLSLSNLSQGSSLNYSLKLPENGLYIFVIAGTVQVLDETLCQRDAIALSEINDVSMRAIEDAELLIIEVPMR
ncbi:MAG TPA: pirin family protein [Coxiellaceae bacterium]|nr:pirin family protein [Coxiellaceae bacterium]